MSEPLTISPTTVGNNALLAPGHADLGRVVASAAAAMVPSTFALSAHEKSELRRCALRAAHVGVANAPWEHYTQGSLRWSGITQQRRSINKQAPPYSDCSSFVTWCYWDSSRWLKLEDFMNGADWLAGFTGTLVQHGKRISGNELQPGDLCFYGDLLLPYHVTIAIGGGEVIGHGRDPGPEITAIGPATQFRSYVI